MSTGVIPRSRQALASRVLRWLGRFLVGFLILLIVLAAAGAVYQAAGAARDRQLYLPPGQMVDVGGYQMHLNCQGTGSPTVIIEALSGGTSSYYPWTQAGLVGHTRVCTYDRVGRAWSEPRPFAVDDPLRQTAEELHTLLENAGISGPLVLAGHSIGGIYTRAYTDLYPDDVAGLVLIDAAHPEQLDRYPQFLEESDRYLQMSASFPFFARIGLFRLYFAAGGEMDFQDLPERQHSEVAAFWSSPEYFLSQRQENLDAAVIYRNAQYLGDLGDLPLVVVSASEAPHATAWPVLQAELAELSGDRVHRIIPGASHVSLAFNPDHAAQVTAAILEVIESVRSGQPLNDE